MTLSQSRLLSNFLASVKIGFGFGVLIDGAKVESDSEAEKMSAKSGSRVAAGASRFSIKCKSRIGDSNASMKCGSGFGPIMIDVCGRAFWTISGTL